ncbi:carbohydrate ABC transporter permease [Massiliimalia massiliensis]|uniref:carbohydrate ABC transporter permease n=1 Tax=Massiliimalia massiliensis TaxID=1852384 RepID=UPI000986ACE5|nr:carbohydrate ABC transporter permease [Massiliimalia massiliensis]
MKKSYIEKQKRTNPMVHIFLILITAFQIFPLIMLFINSLRTDKEIKNFPIGIPTSLDFSNYIETWQKGGYTSAFISSFSIGFTCVLVILVFGGLASYALAKLYVPFKSFFLGYFTLGMSIPGFLFITPNYTVFTKLGIVNTRLSMIIIYSAIFLSFNLLLLRTYLIGIPKELEEAGKIDGCSEVSVVWYVTMPIARPIFSTVALLVFVQCWNEFLWANTYLSTDDVRTVSTRFYKFVSQYSMDLASVFTAGAIAIGPIIILYIALQKKFIEGMTSGAVKG